METTRTGEDSGGIDEFDRTEEAAGETGSAGSGSSGLSGFKRRVHKWPDEEGNVVFEHVKWREDRWAYRHKVPKGKRAELNGREACPEHEGSELRTGGWCPKMPAAADNLMWNIGPLLSVLDDPKGIVLWVAGEKDADAAQAYANRYPGNVAATTVHQGESRTSTLTEGQQALLRGARCQFRLYWDRDATGIRNALARADALAELGITRVVLRKLPGAWLEEDESPDSPWSGVNDISDLFRAKGTLSQCEDVEYDELPVVTPLADEQEPGKNAPARGRAARRASIFGSGHSDVGPRVRALLDAVRAVRPDAETKTVSGKVHISCPLPDHLDLHPSFAVTEGRNGGILLTCTCDTSTDKANRWPWLRKVFRCLDISQPWIAPLGDLPRNDKSRAAVFAALNRDRLLYVRETKEWLHWNGQVWRPDGEAVLEAITELEDEFHSAAEKLSDEKQQAALHSFAVACGNAAKIRDTLSLAAEDHGLGIGAARFDAEPNIITVRNGTLELGESAAGIRLRGHRPQDMCRMVARAGYVPDAQSVRWNSFLEDVQPNRNTRKYLQTALGYCLLGRNPERVMFFLTGPTSTGKTTIATLIMNTLGGGLSGPFQLSMFRTKRDDAPRPDILKAIPRRIIVAEEGSSEWNLHADVIKAMTSGGVIDARAMRSNSYVERVPAFTPIIATNQWPEIKHADTATKRRIIGIPFTAQIERGADDIRLTQRFGPDDHDAILGWLVRGYETYVREGLEEPPAAVAGITQEIHDSISPVDQFVIDMCELDEDFKVPAPVLYEAYRIWWDANGKHGEPQNAIVFGQEVTERTGMPIRVGKERGSNRSVRMRHGIRLR